MAREHDQNPGSWETGNPAPSARREAESDRDGGAPGGPKGFGDTTGPGAQSEQAPEEGTLLDEATGTVTNTGPSS
jgi:hypothetical protein